MKKQISLALGMVLLFVWTAAMAEERVRTSILVRYTTVPVEAVIYPEEDFEVKDTAAFVAQELCPILKREPVTFPVRYVIQWPKMLPDGASVVSDDSRTQAGVLADCLPRSHM